MMSSEGGLTKSASAGSTHVLSIFEDACRQDSSLASTRSSSSGHPWLAGIDAGDRRHKDGARLGGRPPLIGGWHFKRAFTAPAPGLAGFAGLGPLCLGSVRSKTRQRSAEAAACYTSDTTGAKDGVQERLPVDVLDVHGPLGTGSFGRVYRCTVRGIEGQVAVKLLEPGMHSQGHLEGSPPVELSHPHLVRMLKVIDDASTSAFVLELCGGGALEHLVHQRTGLFGCVCAGQRLRAAGEVASALDYLHSFQVVHRDIKPSNVFLSQPVVEAAVVKLPTVKLGDLGLARLVRSWRDPRQMERCVGTVRYMAPEVMTEDDYGLPADIFSWAILLHELISGEMPYSSTNQKSDSSLMLDILGGERPSLDLITGPGLAQSLRRVVVACWHTEPRVRPTSDQLLEAVTQLLEQTTASLDWAD